MTASEQEFLYVAPGLWSMVQESVPDSPTVTDASGVVIALTRTFNITQVPGELDAERLLDRHWVIFKRGDSEGRRLAELCLFNVIADHYEVEIDTERNRANFRMLLREAMVGPDATVLDFGSGPGLSLRSSDDIRVIGCDASPAMREQAERRGLVCIPPEELGTLRNSVDAIVASYVLHLAIPSQDILTAAECVRIGGRLVANFHKSRGLAATERTLERSGRFRQTSVATPEHPLHGPIRAWERRE